MEIRKIECPSCGAPLEWNSSACGFCKTELRFFEDEGAALPTNLRVEDIESNIIMLEKEFWKATIRATDAPYSIFKDYKNSSEQDFKNDIYEGDTARALKMFYESYFILPSENYIAYTEIDNNGLCSVLLTSLRLIIVRDGLLSIPLEDFVSWQAEKSVAGSTIVGGENDTVLRYLHGDTQKELRFDTFSASNCLILQNGIQSVRACKEWNELTPLQKNLLNLNRYTVNKIYKIQVKPLLLMDINQTPVQSSNQAKKGCFVATATMGNYKHPVVLQLQDFRDNILCKKAWGRQFIKFYNQHGPAAAKIIEKNNILRFISYALIVKPLSIIVSLFKK
ncbi:MAG: CFI-box-CTERM domain-containing protein [Bacteroidota bacterium]